MRECSSVIHVALIRWLTWPGRGNHLPIGPTQPLPCSAVRRGSVGLAQQATQELRSPHSYQPYAFPRSGSATFSLHLQANCLGLFELRPRSARHSRPHSVDASERLQFLQAVPVLTTGGSVEMSPPPDADKEEAGAGPSGSEEAQTRMKAVPAVFVPVDVSGEVFERYCQMRRSMRGVEYQPVVVKRQRRQQRQRASTAEQRSQSYDALGPQLQALHDPSRTTVPLPGEQIIIEILCSSQIVVGFCA